MTAPSPVPATQVRHPWRATLRTVVAAFVAALPILPVVADQLGLATVPWLAGGLTAIGGVTRVLAMPTVEAWLHRYAPWLAAQPTEPGQ